MIQRLQFIAARCSALVLAGLCFGGCANSSSSDWAQTQPTIRPATHTVQVIDITSWRSDEDIILADEYMGELTSVLP